MKKIGLCVCYNTRNFGSKLQTLATQIKISELGFDYEIIRYKKKIDFLFIIKSMPRLLNFLFLKNKFDNKKKTIIISSYPNIKLKCKLRNDRFNLFNKTHFDRLSKEYIGYNSLIKNVGEYDAVLVGSDQLWLPSGLASNFYNLNFVPDYMTKISYATSFGVSKIPWYQLKRTKNYLERFDFLSVRENQGAKIINELIGRYAEVLLDPTLMYDCAHWNKIIASKQVLHYEYIFCYFLGDNIEHRKIAEELSQQTGLKIVTIPFLDNFIKYDLEFGDEQLYDISPEEFLNLIRHCEYMLTDSFHGSAFSILNHKKFVVLNRFSSKTINSRNSRIDSLCNSLYLNNRRYKKNIQKTAEADIDYNKVDELLEKMRKKTDDFLKNALDSI